MAEIYALHAGSGQAAKELLKAMLWQNEAAEFAQTRSCLWCGRITKCRFRRRSTADLPCLDGIRVEENDLTANKKSIESGAFLVFKKLIKRISVVVAPYRALAGGVDLLPAGCFFLGALAHMPRVMAIVRNGGNGEYGDGQAEHNDIDRADTAR
jgi:hypothetical protein